MPVLNIRIFPDPILKLKSKRVRAIDGSIKHLVSDMLETLHAVPGRAGLAAPQVGVSLRVIVIGIPDAEDVVLVNPVIVRRSGERLIDEGCLSLPGYWAEVKRAESVTAKGRDLSGKEIRVKGDGLLAQALEHEVDHLDGLLYLDRLESMDKLYKVEPKDKEAED